MVIISSGMALVFIPLTSTSLHNIGNHDAGVASAMVNTSQQIGGSLGTALLNTIAATATASFIKTHHQLGQAAIPAGMVHGFTRSFIVGAIILLVGAAILFAFINVGKDSLVESEGAILH
jgi:hypothetical protein